MVQAAVQSGRQKRARLFNRHAIADAVRAAGPTGIDEPAFGIMLSDEVAQQIAIF